MELAQKKIFKIVGVSGSLRKLSKNTGLLRACQKLAPQNFSIEIADISQFPVYNEDLHEKEVPECVQKVIKQLKEADAFIFGVAEYNYSIAAPLKNSIDWCNRDIPNYSGVFSNKYVGMVSAAGRYGGTRAQYHLRQIGVEMDVKFINKEFFCCGFGENIFNENGDLVSQELTDRLKTYIEQLFSEVEKQAK